MQKVGSHVGGSRSSTGNWNYIDSENEGTVRPDIMICSERFSYRKVWSEQCYFQVGCSKNVVHVAPLRDTFGTEMSVKVSADSHFRTLRSLWDVSAKAKMEDNPNEVMEDYQI